MSFLLAALSGALMAVQGALNAGLAKFAGLGAATLLVHLIGTAAAFVYVVLSGEMRAARWLGAPWYAYLGGVASIFIICLVAYTIGAIGAANATTAIIVGQVLTALAIDWLGFGGLKEYAFHWRQIFGLALLSVGAKLLLR